MDRRRVIRRVGALVLVVNVCLVIAKTVVWQATGSLAVGSEAVNSAADTVYSLVVFAGMYVTTQPPDFKHPHGHERIEPFVALFVAVGIFVAGVFVLWQAITTIRTGTVSTIAGAPAVAVLLGTAIVKLLLYRFCLRMGTEHNSPAVIATALDSRTDILTAGAALVGVVGANIGYPLLDPIAAVVVAVGILYTGLEIVRDNINYLVGGAPPPELRTKIVQRALGHPDVKGAHDVIAHYVGPEIDVSLHIEVEGDMTVTEAHNIESAVMESICAIEKVDDVFVHIDPKELGEWKKHERVDPHDQPE